MRRRFAAVVLPRLAVEIARSRDGVKGPLAIVFDSAPARAPALAEDRETIGSASDEARRYGVRPEQKVAEALVLVPRLTVLRVSFAEIGAALARVAAAVAPIGGAALQIRSATRFAGYIPEPRGATGSGPFDTVWIDVTAASRGADADRALIDDLDRRTMPLGHVTQIAIADGPRTAQALARWGASVSAPVIAEVGRGGEALAPLPLRALPLPSDRVAFLLRVGVLTVGDLAKLPRTEAMARLGPRGAEVLAMAAGFDPAEFVLAPPPAGESPP